MFWRDFHSPSTLLNGEGANNTHYLAVGSVFLLYHSSMLRGGGVIDVQKSLPLADDNAFSVHLVPDVVTISDRHVQVVRWLANQRVMDDTDRALCQSSSQDKR